MTIDQQAALTIEDLSVSFGPADSALQALDKVSLTADKGEILAHDPSAHDRRISEAQGGARS